MKPSATAGVFATLAILGCSAVLPIDVSTSEPKQFAPSDADNLIHNAQLVVIGTAKSWRQTDEAYVFGEKSCRTHCVGVETTFEVECVIKGTYHNTELSLCHYMIAPGTSQDCMFCPHLVVFKTPDRLPKAGDFQANPIPQYLLFLKQDQHGRLVPVSDQVYPGASAFEVWGMDFGTSLKEMEKHTQQGGGTLRR